MGTLRHNLLLCPRTPIPAHHYSLAGSSASPPRGQYCPQGWSEPRAQQSPGEQAWSPASRPHTTSTPLVLVQPGCTLNFVMPASLIPCVQLDPDWRSTGPELQSELTPQTPGWRIGLSALGWRAFALPSWGWVGWGCDMQQIARLSYHWLRTQFFICFLIPPAAPLLSLLHGP